MRNLEEDGHLHTTRAIMASVARENMLDMTETSWEIPVMRRTYIYNACRGNKCWRRLNGDYSLFRPCHAMH